LAIAFPPRTSGYAAVYDGTRVVAESHSAEVNAETLFDIGSIVKTFTAVAVLRLADAHKLSLDASISKYIAGVPADKAPITIRDLLTHRSGLVRYVSDGDFIKISRDDVVKVAMTTPLSHPPGTVEEYADTNYHLLAVIIELITHKPFAEYIEATILKPLHLDHTMFYGDPRIARLHVAKGFVDGVEKGDAATFPLTWSIIGAGGMLSDAKDMSRWIDWIARQHRAEFEQPPMKRWSAGFEIRTKPPMVLKGGANDYGYLAAIGYVPGTERRAVVLINRMSSKAPGAHHTMLHDLLAPEPRVQ
ncbi:MAG TPA: serine hydrolase domain-containing protein, partial [Thermoanaerobaculia bacterium]|nr:serine hydrolase domain-containing protein [Thermoanaerobaculia bacterium]